MKEKITPGYYAIIPADVRYNKNLSQGSKLLYGEITALCNKEGYCWASNSYFADLYGCVPQTISNWIQELISERFIRTENFPEKGNLRHIYLNLTRNQESFDFDEKTTIQNNYIVSKNFDEVSKNFGEVSKPFIDLSKNFITNNNTINTTSNIKRNMNTLWISTFGRNPKMPEIEETEKLIKRFGEEKTYIIYKEASLRGFRNLKTLIDALDENGNIKPLEKNNGNNQRESARGSIDVGKYARELATIGKTGS